MHEKGTQFHPIQGEIQEVSHLTSSLLLHFHTLLTTVPVEANNCAFETLGGWSLFSRSSKCLEFSCFRAGKSFQKFDEAQEVRIQSSRFMRHKLWCATEILLLLLLSTACSATNQRLQWLGVFEKHLNRWVSSFCEGAASHDRHKNSDLSITSE